jgi:hypothetical protein
MGNLRATAPSDGSGFIKDKERTLRYSLISGTRRTFARQLLGQAFLRKLSAANATRACESVANLVMAKRDLKTAQSDLYWKIPRQSCPWYEVTGDLASLFRRGSLFCHFRHVEYAHLAERQSLTPDRILFAFNTSMGA